jgi:hypothetical protein
MSVGRHRRLFDRDENLNESACTDFLVGTPETAVQATEIDRLCGYAWGRHCRYVLIDNSNRDWSGKVREAYEIISNWVTESADVE